MIHIVVSREGRILDIALEWKWNRTSG